MAWIESHTVLMRHRKVAHLANALRLRRSAIIGHLHALWHAALEQQDDGDLSSWSDEFIAECSDFPGDAPQYVRLLQEAGWLDGKLLHDWPDYAGAFLRSRYASGNRERLVAIWAKHGRPYGEATGKQPETNRQPTRKKVPPDHTGPDPTKPDQGNPPAPFFEIIPENLRSSPQFVAAWAEFVQHRQEIRHRLTPLAAEKCLKKLAKYPAVAIEAIEVAISNGWQGVFPENITRPHGANGARPTRQEQHQAQLLRTLSEIHE